MLTSVQAPSCVCYDGPVAHCHPEPVEGPRAKSRGERAALGLLRLYRHRSNANRVRQPPRRAGAGAHHRRNPRAPHRLAHAFAHRRSLRDRRGKATRRRLAIHRCAVREIVARHRKLLERRYGTDRATASRLVARDPRAAVHDRVFAPCRHQNGVVKRRLARGSVRRHLAARQTQRPLPASCEPYCAHSKRERRSCKHPSISNAVRRFSSWSRRSRSGPSGRNRISQR